MVDIFLISVIAFSIVSIGMILALTYKEWNSFLFPQNWNHIIMLEFDNNIKSFLIMKNKNNRFEFKEGIYNMFDRADSIGSSIYRKGRVACFLYKEGNENPIDFRNLEITGNPQLKKKMDLIDISALWVNKDNSFLGFLKDFSPLFILAGIAIIIVLIFQLKGNGG